MTPDSKGINPYRKTCPSCKRILNVRLFCRPKLQIQATCRACWRSKLLADTTGKKIQHALSKGLLPAPVAAYMRRKLDERKQRLNKKEAERKSAQMTKYHAARRNSGVKE